MTLRNISLAWNRFFFRPTAPYTIALFRIYQGLLLFAIALSLYPNRDIWGGPASIRDREYLPPELMRWQDRVISLFPGGEPWSTLFLGVFAVSALGLAIGFKSRWNAAITFVCVFCTYYYTEGIHSGSIQVLLDTGLLFLFANSGAAWSIDSVRLRKAGRRAKAWIEPWPWRLMQIQFSAIYLSTTLYKMRHATWWDGTATYYPARLWAFQHHYVPGLFEWVPAIRITTWGTLAVEGALGVFLWFRRTRYWAIAAGLAFHLSLDYALAIPFFQWTMIGGLLLFCDPRDVVKFWRTRREGSDVGPGIPSSRPGPHRSSDREPEKPATVFAMPTCERPAALGRGLSSYATNFARYGRKVRFVVADDSSSDRTRARNRDVVAAIRGEFGAEIGLIDRDSKAAFALALAAESGVEAALVEAAIGAGDESNRCIGANRNALFLETVGERFLSADDDTVCEAYRWPEADRSLTTQTSWSTCPCVAIGDPSEALSLLPRGEVDLVGAHARVLGRRAGEIISDTWTRSTGEISPERSDGRVRVSWTGIVGDSGYASNLFLLFLRGAERDHLVRSEPIYRRLLESRQIVRVPDRYAIMPPGSLQSTIVGFDHSNDLPPFMPISRGEDLVFGDTLRKTDRADFVAMVPCGLLHLPIEKRTATFEEQLRYPMGAHLHVLMRAILAECPDAAVPERGGTSVVGNFVARFATLGAGIRRDMLEHAARTHWGEIASYLDGSLESLGRSPEYWARDVAEFADRIRKRRDSSDKVVVSEFERGRDAEAAFVATWQAVARYGELLGAWPEMIGAAARLNSRGLRLARGPNGY